MAALTFYTYNLSGERCKAENILSFELSKSLNAPCDGLRLTYLRSGSADEISRVEVFDDEKKIFNGFCDTQQEETDSDGIVSFIYARSSICLLVDNQAQPCIYQSPSAESLFIKNARQFGFVNAMPNIYCDSLYQVSNGVSCYAAINSFVNGITGKRVMADAHNRLLVPDENGTVNLNDYTVLSEKRIINRGQALTVIDYKINSSEDYVYHCKSHFAERQGIKTSKKVNVSSLPEWQRKYTLSNMLHAGSSKYYSVELMLDGCCDFSLYDKVFYKSGCMDIRGDYFISAVSIFCDSKGESTKLTLYKNIDSEEINYVD